MNKLAHVCSDSDTQAWHKKMFGSHFLYSRLLHSSTCFHSYVSFKMYNSTTFHSELWGCKVRGCGGGGKGGGGRGEKLKAKETKVISFSACWLSWACCFASWPFFVIGASSWDPQGQAHWGLVVDDQVAVTTTTQGTQSLVSAVGPCLWCRCWHHSKTG